MAETLALAGSRVLAGAMQASALVIVARRLGPTSFGQYAIVSSATLVAASFMDFGLRDRALRLAREEQSAAIAKGMIVLRVASCTALTGVALSVGHFAGVPWRFSALVSVAIMGDLVGDLAANIFLARGRHLQANGWLLVRRLLPFLLLIRQPGGDVETLGALAVGAIVGAAAAVFCVAPLGGPVANPWALLKGSGNYWKANIATNLFQADGVWVTGVGGPALGGLYAAVARMANPINMLANSALQIAVLRLSRATEDATRVSLRVRVERLFWCYGAALVALSPAAYWAIPLALGPKYSLAGPLGVSIVLSAACSVVMQGYIAWYISDGVPSWVPRVLALVVVTTLAGLIVGAAAQSVMALAVAMASGNALGVILFAWRRKSGDSGNEKRRVDEGARQGG